MFHVRAETYGSICFFVESIAGSFSHSNILLPQLQCACVYCSHVVNVSHNQLHFHGIKDKSYSLKESGRKAPIFIHAPLPASEMNSHANFFFASLSNYLELRSTRRTMMMKIKMMIADRIIPDLNCHVKDVVVFWLSHWRRSTISPTTTTSLPMHFYSF